MGKRITVFIVLMTLLAISFAGKTDAQFWKKKSRRSQTEQASDSTNVQTHVLTRKEKREKRKEERRKKKEERKHKAKQQADAKYNPHPKAVAPVVKGREDIVYPPTIFKPRYRIDVLAPLYLDDLVKGKYITFNDKIPQKASSGVSFIEGVNIAADSLKNAGFNVDIYVHDVSNFQESSELLATKGKLDSSDLILAAVSPRDLPVLATFAKRKHVYFISALSPADGGVRDNPYFTLIEPSLKSHCEGIVKEVANKYPGQSVALLYRTAAPADINAYSCIVDAGKDKVSFKTLLCNPLPHRDDLAPLFDSGKTNVVIIPVTDINYSDSILRELSRDFPGTRFEVYGMPSWDDIADVHKPKGLPNLGINISDAFSYNPASASGIYVERNFKRDYAGKTSELVYRGYELLLWYANLLKQYGTMFKNTDSAPAPFTPFEISPQWDKNNDLLYNENTHTVFLRYEGGVAK